MVSTDRNTPSQGKEYEGDKHSEDSLPEQRADDEEDYVPKDLTSWREIRSETQQNKEVCYALQCAFASLPQECEKSSCWKTSHI